MESTVNVQTLFVTAEEELKQIEMLSQANAVHRLPKHIKEKEGFVTWPYTFDILLNLHNISPSIIIKHKKQVIGYALVLPKEATRVYQPLQKMLEGFEKITYKNRPLNSFHFYVMGQICVHPDFRGKGIFQMLYQEHKRLFSHQYDFVLTEISIANQPSLRAHQKTGFQSIQTCKDELGEWDVVIWDWK